MRQPLESHLDDDDMKKAPAALLRAAKRAKELARQTGTPFVVVRDGILISEVPPSEEKSSEQSET